MYHLRIRRIQMRTPLLCSGLFNMKSNVDKKNSSRKEKKNESSDCSRLMKRRKKNMSITKFISGIY
jgi:hypothetical protein